MGQIDQGFAVILAGVAGAVAGLVVALISSWTQQRVARRDRENASKERSEDIELAHLMRTGDIRRAQLERVEDLERALRERIQDKNQARQERLEENEQARLDRFRDERREIYARFLSGFISLERHIILGQSEEYRELHREWVLTQKELELVAGRSVREFSGTLDRQLDALNTMATEFGEEGIEEQRPRIFEAVTAFVEVARKDLGTTD